jgi:hypothetical protein
MLIIAILFWNSDNYNKVNFPIDSDNLPCSYGINKNYQFIYFPDITDVNTVSFFGFREFALVFVPQVTEALLYVDPILKFLRVILVVLTLLK